MPTRSPRLSPIARTAIVMGLVSLGVLIAPAPVAWAKQVADPTDSTAVTDEAVIALIDAQLRDAWREAGVKPSKRAPDPAWARRVYLDLLGRVPTVEELEAFAALPARDRRAALVDQLLGSGRRPERARWQATEWANLLIGRTGGIGGQSLAERDGFLSYLRQAFAENRPYDVMTRELITATGSVRSQDDDFNGAASFLADKMADGGVQATAKTAQVFLGVAVQCTQCHDHPFNEWRQNQFWELNAFFRQTRVERVRDEDSNRRHARIVDRDFYGEGKGPRSVSRLAPGQREKAEIFYELRNGKLKVAYPVFVDGTSLSEVFTDRGFDTGDSGRLALVNRREELASLVTTAPELARSGVNREWGRFFGYGFTSPPEDMGPHNPPSHPELLEELADAFRDTGYDLRRLTRWIVLSEAYGLDSRAGASNEEDDPALGVAPKFSRFYLRQLTAEQIYESLMTATRADEAVPEERRDRARQRWIRQFNTAFGNDENGEATTFNGSIPQALALMNSDLMRQATALRWSKPDKKGADGKPVYATDREPLGFLSEVAADRTADNLDKVKRLYMASLAREPSRPELRVCNQLLAARKRNANEALRDIWWALLNSNEFILQH